MAVRHLGELKKKKKSYRARAEVGIHESTYVVGVHFSNTRGLDTSNLRQVAARIPGTEQLPLTSRGAGGPPSAE